MTVTRINFIIDISLMALAILQGISSMMLLIGSNATALGTTSYEWATIHRLIGSPMVILLIIHLALCWKWIIDETKNIFSMSLFDSI